MLILDLHKRVGGFLFSIQTESLSFVLKFHHVDAVKSIETDKPSLKNWLLVTLLIYVYLKSQSVY